MMAELLIVEDENDHRKAMEIIDKLSSSKRVEDRGRLRAQSLLVSDWEAKRFPLEEQDAAESLRFWIEQSNLPMSEIQKIFGGRSHMSEVLTRKRALSKSMMVAAHKLLRVPLNVLFELLEDEPTLATAVPAVAVKDSVTPDYIVCLEDGKRFKMLRRHLLSAYKMTPEQYRAKWGLPANYPMVAPRYARQKNTYLTRKSVTASPFKTRVKAAT
jgi:predicted transcriptional regulator